MAKVAESEPLDLEDEVKPIKDEIKKPNIFLKHWKKKDTPYGNDYTTNFAQAPDSPRYPDEDKGYKSETYIGGKKKDLGEREPENSDKFQQWKKQQQKLGKTPEILRREQQVNDDEAAASYMGDVAQQKVGTRVNDLSTNAGKYFKTQPKHVRQHYEHENYDPDLAEKWKAKLNKISQVHLMNVDDESPPTEKGLTHNADASQATKGIKPIEKILPAIPMLANIATSLASGGGDEEEETNKSYHSNCPYCNGKSNNKQHDENPDKFHAWMDTQKSWLDISKGIEKTYEAIEKLESADPSKTQHQPKRRRAHIMDAGKPAKDIRSKREDTDLDLKRQNTGVVPKGDIRTIGSFDSAGNWINPQERERITPPEHKINPNPKIPTVNEPRSKASPMDTRPQPDARDRITPRLSGGFIQDHPINPVKPKPERETPQGNSSPNLKPKERKGVKGFLSDKNPFSGRKQKPQEEGYIIDDIGNIGVKVGGDKPNQKAPDVEGKPVDIGKSFYSLRTKDGYGSGDLSLQNVTPNTVVNDKETYIGQTANSKHRMVDRNKITKTKVGDDIHFFVNGVEDRGVVVKMGSEYLQVFKEDGHFHDIHINDTFFVKDIIVNKEWDKMDAPERYEALQKIHAPSPRFIGKSWAELPIEITELLTKRTNTGARIPSESGSMGAASTELPPRHDNETPNVEDENTKYYSAYSRKLLGTGAKGKLLQQNEKDPKKVNQLLGKEYDKTQPSRYLEIPSYQEKSDVEEGTYGNVGNTSDVAPSTSTNLDVSESTGYEERPHISVEEVGSLPRRDAKDNGDDETKEKEDDIKEPKESKDTQKVGVPTANYNTFGITYSVKANTVWNKKTQRWEQKDE